MQQPEPEKNQKHEGSVEKPKSKPEPIVNWENEGGNVIPTGSLPKVSFPKPEDQEHSKQ